MSSAGPSRAVDVVFCDLMMPDMDGIQIVRHMATLAAPPAIVFVSGADDVLLSAAENTARARGLRVIGAIEKPLTPKRSAALSRGSARSPHSAAAEARSTSPRGYGGGVGGKTVPALFPT